MRLLKLRFTNVNSLEGTWEIDFTDPEYVRSGLFAIVGPTGSGKSTILDAISLALYASTPRIRALRKSDAPDEDCPTLTKGCRITEAAVRFEADGTQYLSSWRRRVKRTGRLSEAEVELIRYSSPSDREGIIIASSKSEWDRRIAEITRMSFEIFTRTVLLAQGAFSNFVKAKDEERVNLLEKITGTGIYTEISKSVYERCKEELGRLDVEQKTLENIAVLSDAERAALLKQSDDAGRSLARAKEELARLSAALEWRSNLDRLKARCAELQELYGAAQKAEASYRAEYERAERAKKAAEPSRLAESVEAARTELSQTVLRIQKLRDAGRSLALQRPHLAAAARLAGEELDKAAREAEAFEPKYRRMLEADTELRQLERKSREAAGQSERAAAELASARARAEAAQRLEREKKAALDALSERVRAGAADDAIAAPLAIIREAAGSIRALQQKKPSAEKRLEAKSAELEREKQSEAQLRRTAEELRKERSLKESARTLAERQLAEAQAGSTPEGALEVMKSLTETIDAAYAFRRTREARLRIEASADRLQKSAVLADVISWWDSVAKPDLAKVRTLLLEQEKALEERLGPRATQAAAQFDGMIAELEASRGSISAWVKNTARAQAALREAQSEETRAAARLRGAEEELAAAAAAVVRLASEEEEARGELAKLAEERASQIAKVRTAVRGIAGLPPDAAEDPDRLVTALAERTARRAKLLSGEQAARSAWQEANNEAVRTGEAVKMSERNAAAAADAAKAAADELGARQAARRQEFGSTDPQAEHERLEAARAARQKSFREAEDKAAELERRLGEGAAELKTLTEAESGRREALERSRAQLFALLKERGFAGEAEARAAVMEESAVAAAEAEYAKRKEEKASAYGRLKSIEEQLAAEEKRALTAEKAEPLRARADAVKERADAVSLQLIEAQSRLKSDDAHREQAQKSASRIEALRSRCALWQELSDLIGSADGKKFRMIAQRYTFRILLASADDALQSMTPRYRLAPSGEWGLGIDVIDGDMGAKRRTSQNLSGGETFLLSLALALGLSRMGGSNLKVDTLFLDEGFGTLDEETLSHALGALERLHAAKGKLIGVISHVQGVRERIATHISVSPRAGSGRSTLSGPGVRRLSGAQ